MQQKYYLRASLSKEILRMKETVKIASIATIAILCGWLLQSNLGCSNENMPYSQIPYCCISPQVPTSLTFAGEEITLTQHDRRERMDREILAFTYSHINTMLQIKRANRLFPIVEPILKECGVPDDFKYLMIIESNGDIHARSAVGAAGLWQFMEKTGREYGLEVNNHVDERYNIEKATRAACKYLKKSYEEFGNWMTVAASYNAGTANISKRIEAQKQSNAIDLVLVPETSRYLFRLLAVKCIFADPINYGFIIKKSDLYPPLPIKSTITIDKSSVSWPDVARKHNLTFLQLREANPWMRSSTMPNSARKSYTVLIPDAEALHYDPKKTQPHDYKWIIR